MPILEGGDKKTEMDLAKSLIPPDSPKEKELVEEPADAAVQVPQDEAVFRCYQVVNVKTDKWNTFKSGVRSE